MHKASLIALLLMTWIPLSANASTKYYRYSIDLTVGDQHLLERYDLVCKSEVDIIAMDFSLRRDWREGPSEIVAKDLGNDLILLYEPTTGGCGNDKQQDMGGFVRVLKDPVAQSALYIGNRLDTDPAIVINRIWLTRISEPRVLLRPTAQQVNLRELVRQHRHGFHTVTYAVIPFEQWGTTDRAREYFSKLTSITVANVGDAVHHDGHPGQFIGFPYAVDRFFPGEYRDEPIATKYVGNEFHASGEGKHSETAYYYPTRAMNREATANPDSVSVEYKGVTFSLKGTREVYDPSTRSILLFAHRVLDRPEPGQDLKDLQIATHGDNSAPP
jgi:hypothetical protein